MRSNQYYVAIDLGSNSFHMLIVRVVLGSIRIIAKIKRRIRLAEGLQSDGSLNAAAQKRALDCLYLFADRVKDIAPENIRAVGTATLRKLPPNDPFIAKMVQTLGHPIQIISGLEEAHYIYQGIAHTSAIKNQLIICDIGGASTEIAQGEGKTPATSISLDMGCVSWKTRFFPNGEISKRAVEQAIQTAEQLIQPHLQQFNIAPEAFIAGASGTFKSLQQIAINRHQPEQLTLTWLNQIADELIQFKSLQTIEIAGLPSDKTLVLLPGLCILIAIFKQLQLPAIETTQAALREGLIYSLIGPSKNTDIQQRTLESLAQHYRTDHEQTARVYKVCQHFLQSEPLQAKLPNQAFLLAKAVAYLHEVGLSLNYKEASKHGHYLLKHTNLPGFSVYERTALLHLLQAVSGIIDEDNQPIELSDEPKLHLLARLLRIAIIACQRRNDSAIAWGHLSFDNQGLITFLLPQSFLAQNPYLGYLLQEESRYQAKLGGLLVTDIQPD